MEKRKQKKDNLQQAIESERIFGNHFIKESMKRGKTISIILPLVNQEDMIDLLAELWDLRVSQKDYATRLLNQKEKKVRI